MTKQFPDPILMIQLKPNFKTLTKVAPVPLGLWSHFIILGKPLEHAQCLGAHDEAPNKSLLM
jgi:hypothetical protein